MRPISFSWNITFSCNYRCPYCWFHGEWQNLASKNRYFSVKELMGHWERIYKKYGSVVIDILGGEPFIYPDFTELIKELSAIHTVNIATNLSCDIKRFVATADPSKVGMRITFHPLFADFDIFLKRALLLKEHNFGDNVTYLAYPPQIRLIGFYKEKFAKECLRLCILTFWGKHEGLNYPDGYTKEEKEIIAPYVDNRCGEKFQVTPREVKGKLCRAGQRYAVIFPDGATVRCGGGASSDSDISMGNFFDKDFQLLNNPSPCSSKYCPCNEWAFLLVGEE